MADNMPGWVLMTEVLIRLALEKEPVTHEDRQHLQPDIDLLLANIEARTGEIIPAEHLGVILQLTMQALCRFTDEWTGGLVFILSQTGGDLALVREFIASQEGWMIMPCEDPECPTSVQGIHVVNESSMRAGILQLRHEHHARQRQARESSAEAPQSAQ